MTQRPTRTVLVVENSETGDLEHALQSCGVPHQPVICRTINDAHDYIFEEASWAGGHMPNPDVIMVEEPSTSVSESFLDHIRVDLRTRHVPVIIVSPSLEDEDVESLYRHGANSLLVKTSDLNDFGRIVRAMARYWLRLNLTTEARGPLSSYLTE